MVTTLLNALSPEDLKGTYTIFKPKFTFFSPLNGFAWWQNKIIENIFKYGNKKDETIQLTTMLFATPDGITFYPTRGAVQPATYFTLDTITQIITELTAFWELLQDNQNTPLIEKWKTDDKKRVEIEKKLSEATKKNLGIIIKKATKNAKVDSSKIKDLINALIRSVLEQIPTKNDPALYLPFTTHTLLLTFMDTKAQNKTIIVPYIETIQKQFSALKDTQNWQNQFLSTFNTNEFENIAAKLRNKGITADNYELALAGALYNESKDFPKIITWQKASYPGFEDFADCGETSARNFMNILTFNPQTKFFDIAKLASNKLLTIPKEVQAFYAQYPLETQAEKTYHDWGILVQNLEGIAYARGNVCEIDAGLGNMLKVLNHLLLGNNQEFLTKSKEEQLDYLTKVLTTEDFALSWAVKEGSNNNVNKKDVDIILLFTVQIPKKEPYHFEWHFEQGHFVIPPIQVTSAEALSQQSLVSNLLAPEIIHDDTYLNLNILGAYIQWTYTNDILKKILTLTTNSKTTQLSTAFTKQLFFTLLKSKDYSGNLKQIIDIFTKPGHITLPEEIYAVLKNLNNPQIIANYIPTLIQNDAHEIVKRLLNDQKNPQDRIKLWNPIIETIVKNNKQSLLPFCKIGIQEIIANPSFNALINTLKSISTNSYFNDNIAPLFNLLQKETNLTNDQRQNLYSYLYDIVLNVSIGNQQAETILNILLQTSNANQTIFFDNKTIIYNPVFRILMQSIIILNDENKLARFLTDQLKQEMKKQIDTLITTNTINGLITLLYNLTKSITDSTVPFIKQIVDGLDSQELNEDENRQNRIYITNAISSMAYSTQKELYPLVKKLFFLLPENERNNLLNILAHEERFKNIHEITNEILIESKFDDEKAFDLINNRNVINYLNKKAFNNLWNSITDDHKLKVFQIYSKNDTFYKLIIPTLSENTQINQKIYQSISENIELKQQFKEKVDPEIIELLKKVDLPTKEN